MGAVKTASLDLTVVSGLFAVFLCFVVLLTSLAATPEDENHGVLIAALRDWLAAANLRGQLLVVVDEGPYVRRMSTQGGALTRVDGRRSVWSEYISARGVKPCLADLSS